MGPLSGVVIWKILYWFGDEDLVIWTATSASVTGVTLVKLPYAQESRQQDPVTLWSI